MTIEVYHWTRMRVDGSKYFTVRAYNLERKVSKGVYLRDFISEKKSYRAAKELAHNLNGQVFFVRNKRRDYPLGVD